MTTLEEFQLHVKRFTQSQLNDRDLLTEHAMGLAGETGEAIDLLKKHLFHGKEFDRAAFTSEMGDCLFYWVALLQRLKLGKTMTVLYNFSFTSLNFLDEMPLQSAPILSLALSTRSGEISSEMISCIPPVGLSSNLNVDDVNTDLFRAYLIFWFLLLRVFNISPDEAMTANIAKLEKRHEGQAFNREAAIKNKLAEAV